MEDTLYNQVKVLAIQERLRISDVVQIALTDEQSRESLDLDPFEQ